jgi:hypothetical protein
MGHLIDAQVADAPRTVPLAVLYTHLLTDLTIRHSPNSVIA